MSPESRLQTMADATHPQKHSGPEPVNVQTSPSASLRARATILILCYNKLSLTQKCLQALEKSTPRHLYHLVLVDNGSSDGSRAYLSDYAARTQNTRALLNESN